MYACLNNSMTPLFVMKHFWEKNIRSPVPGDGDLDISQPGRKYKFYQPAGENYRYVGQLGTGHWFASQHEHNLGVLPVREKKSLYRFSCYLTLDY